MKMNCVLTKHQITIIITINGHTNAMLRKNNTHGVTARPAKYHILGSRKEKSNGVIERKRIERFVSIRYFKI